MAASCGDPAPGGAPPLPSSPMSPETAPVRRPDRLLPWSTPLLTGSAGAIAGLLWHHWYAVCVAVPAVRYIVVATALMGFGACLADRLPSRVPRALRWALGTAVGALVPISGGARLGVQFRQPGSWPSLAWPVGYGLLACTAIGLLLGSLAASPGRRWHMLVDGALLVPFLAALGTLTRGWGWRSYGGWWSYDGFCGRLSETWTVCHANGDPLRALLSDALLGFLLGLAFAIGDRYAVERRAQR